MVLDFFLGGGSRGNKAQIAVPSPVSLWLRSWLLQKTKNNFIMDHMFRNEVQLSSIYKIH